MIDRIPVDKLYHTVVVTDDAKAMARNYAEFFGIDTWKVVHHTRERLSNTSIRGRGVSWPAEFNLTRADRGAGEASWTTAEGENPTTGLRFQLVQPTGGLSTYEEFLVTRGPGIHSLFLAVTDADALAELKTFLAGEGIGIAQSYTVDDAADVHLFDTRKALGGYYVKVVRPRVAGWEDAIAADETWDFSNQVKRPERARAMTGIRGLNHFGVVVEDLQETLANVARLYGRPVWRGSHWSSFTGSLIDCTNNGAPVKHSYFTAMAMVGENPTGLPFGFEMIQPTFGPSHYKEDFLQPLGPGIHHIDVMIPFEAIEDFTATDFWWRDIGAPVCMSGWLRNKNVAYPQFAYQDTRALLGFVTETHPGKQAPLDPSIVAPPFKPQYVYDFSARAEA